jgi:hypothetical protein
MFRYLHLLYIESVVRSPSPWPHVAGKIQRHLTTQKPGEKVLRSILIRDAGSYESSRP